jgi:hypothetical protein
MYHVASAGRDTGAARGRVVPAPPDSVELARLGEPLDFDVSNDVATPLPAAEFVFCDIAGETEELSLTLTIAPSACRSPTDSMALTAGRSRLAVASFSGTMIGCWQWGQFTCCPAFLSGARSSLRQCGHCASIATPISQDDCRMFVSVDYD